MGKHANGGIIGAYAASSSTTAPGIWTANEIAQRRNQSIFNWPPSSGDASFSSVKCLLHFQDFPAISTGGFLDKSGAGNNAGINGISGNTTGSSTLQVKWGLRSVAMAGGNPLLVQSTADFAFGTGDFTTEGWFYFNNGPVSCLLIGFRTVPTPGSDLTPCISTNGSQKLVMYVPSSGVVITGTTTVSTSTWHYVALSRASGTSRLYLDGTQEGSSFSDSNNYVQKSMLIGGEGNATESINGYAQEVRITKGVGRYTGASMTVPTAPLPDY